MMPQQNVWLVIPTYNERTNLEALVRRITAVGPWNILIVDDEMPIRRILREMPVPERGVPSRLP